METLFSGIMFPSICIQLDVFMHHLYAIFWQKQYNTCIPILQESNYLLCASQGPPVLYFVACRPTFILIQKFLLSKNLPSPAQQRKIFTCDTKISPTVRLRLEIKNFRFYLSTCLWIIQINKAPTSLQPFQNNIQYIINSTLPIL